jgi:hypothetical protein
MPIGIPFTWYYKELAVTVWANNRQAAENRYWYWLKHTAKIAHIGW